MATNEKHTKKYDISKIKNPVLKSIIEEHNQNSECFTFHQDYHDPRTKSSHTDYTEEITRGFFTKRKYKEHIDGVVYKYDDWDNRSSSYAFHFE